MYIAQKLVWNREKCVGVILTESVGEVVEGVAENDHPAYHGDVAVDVRVAVSVRVRMAVAPFNVKSRLFR